MTPEAIVATFGPGYPGAVLIDSLRLPLIRETRWKRFYGAETEKVSAEVSRLMDGSTVFNVNELQNEWSNWRKDERDKFTSALSCAKVDSNILEMRDFVGLPKLDCT